MPEELVSVIIPTYNRAYLLQRAINSALAQTYHPIEVIVIDDGSTDNTTSVLATYGGRIKVIRQPNGGVSSARNQGLLHARGEYITFLDSDDLWALDKVTEQVSALRSRPETSVSYTWYIMVDENGKFLRSFTPQHTGDIFKALYLNNFLRPDLMARRCCFWDRDELKLQFDTDLAYGEDWKLWLQLSLLWQFCCVPKYLVCMTDHPKRVYKTGQLERILCDQSKLENFLWNDSRATKEISALGTRAKAVWPMRNAYLWLLKGERRKAVKSFLDALLIDPLYLPVYTGLIQTLIGRKFVEKLIALGSKRHHLDTQAIRSIFPHIDVYLD